MRSTVDEAAARLIPLCGENCRVGMILGSGLGGYAAGLEHARALDYAEIPGFPVSRVPGHQGRFVAGERFGKAVLCMQGRFHHYEGHPAQALALGVRAMFRAGVTHLILTNAAGGVDEAMRPGDLMLISDHINFAGVNPLVGENDDSFGPRFPDQTNVYDRALRARVREAAAAAGVPLREGVYMMFSGPCFETPAEIRMARLLGASAVGMSTVPEAIAASHCGMKTVGISLITNLAAGILDQPLSHEEVQEAASAASERFSALLDRILSSFS